MKKLPLRPNVCMVVVNSQGKIFLGERSREAGIWQLPQGGVDKWSTIEENIVRELHEELGASPNAFKIIKRLNALHEYDFSNPPEYALGKWRGQSQTFWLVEYLGADKDIKLDSYEEIELINWKWCTIDEIRKLSEPKRLVGYEKVFSEVEEYLTNWSL